MNHWLLENIDELVQQSLAQAARIQIYNELLNSKTTNDDALEQIQRSAEALEMIVYDLILESHYANEENESGLKQHAADAFRLYRVLPGPDDAMGTALHILKTSILAVLGDKGADASRWLKEGKWPELPLESEDWGERTLATILSIWLRLIRKNGWADRDAVLEEILNLRDSQKTFESDYLNGQNPDVIKASAVELVGLYHLAKAAEILALYITDGVVEGNYQIHQLLDAHFDRAHEACKLGNLVGLEPLSWLLSACASQLADNSIWTVTRAVNSRVTKFVESLVDKGRGERVIFDVLPPQRRTLAEKGLLGSSRRAVVVSLPTSSGKTMIAEFRILQALNQFDQEHGWVAYLAPTRTLVNQITRQLRRDFDPININVEQVSPALEIDNIENVLLHQSDEKQQFNVLVTTPEKLDLMLRQGLESEIKRPLTLVVVDEAHNIQSASRGLKLELLLATINKECQRAQFLLLTPFINNAREVARWLGGPNSEDVSMSVDWQPNDRVIGIVQAHKGEHLKGRSYDYDLKLETVHTTRNTLAVDEHLDIPKTQEIARTYSQASDLSSLAAMAAQSLQERGPVIVMHSRPAFVWSLAEKFKIAENRKAPSTKIKLVQEFLALEFGDEFPLIDLMLYGVGVHHAGLSDDVRALMEWLFEENELSFLVATTTISQGVNFPVTGVVMASHEYPYGVEMPPEDFWNIAGRAGRIGQGSLGIIALTADSNSRADILREFINNQSGDLNSALITMAQKANSALTDLRRIIYRYPEWSSFVQYLAHTYRQMGNPDGYADQIEQVLRGTFGFEKLRTKNSTLANKLLEGIHTYTKYLQEPGQPLKLVDSTGFSLQSIKRVLYDSQNAGIKEDTWNPNSLFAEKNHDLKNMMGVLLQVPELRKNLIEATGGELPDGNKLALIVKDWVNGVSIPEIANTYFMKSDADFTKAMTRCGQNLFGRLTQTAAWGLGALLTITGGNLSEKQLRDLSNLPSQVYYGVNTDEAIVLRLLGVPRSAAGNLAVSMSEGFNEPLPVLRKRLRDMKETDWQQPLGAREGKIYYDIWRILEGLE